MGSVFIAVCRQVGEQFETQTSAPQREVATLDVDLLGHIVDMATGIGVSVGLIEPGRSTGQ